ncbi:YihY/virulence factor BrkB family protein [Uliginosibacterium sp. H1]|uniref:YihY/virulence factor BrkB family protein n=1 Tax=Uliginosibacterium sp. H1 TaxID=3114757 RepID=UPI002E17E63D|nr:YihY/virulence factor BrkB family protein [Uliginosibacterium sp. H1]
MQLSLSRPSHGHRVARSVVSRLSIFGELVVAAVTKWSDDRAPSMGAALAYYTAFSIAPLLLIVTTIAGLVFGRDAAEGAIAGQISGLVGAHAAEAIQAMLQNADRQDGGLVGTLIGFGMLLVGATTVFVELQNDLDRIWKAPERTGSGVMNFLVGRLLTFSMVLGIGFLMIISLVVTSAVAALGQVWSEAFVGMEIALQVLNFAVSFIVTAVLFAMIYKILPNVRIAWRDVTVGAAINALLFSLGKFLIGLYIGKSAVSSSYGAAGAFAVLLIWVYYSTQIFLLGAEFTYVYAHREGSHSDKPAALLTAPPP